MTNIFSAKSEKEIINDDNYVSLSSSNEDGDKKSLIARK